MIHVRHLAALLLCFEATALPADPPPGVYRTSIGVTRRGTPIEAWLDERDFDLRTTKTRVLLIGLAGDRVATDLVHAAMKVAHGSLSMRERLAVSAVPSANPDGRTTDDPTHGYPPANDACYHSPTNPEAAYLWRWIGMHAPDLVVDVRAGDATSWLSVRNTDVPFTALQARLQPSFGEARDDELVVQLGKTAACDTGLIPALRVVSRNAQFFEELVAAIEASGYAGPSPARAELQRRVQRTPVLVAEQLANVYGHTLPDVAYIPAVAMVGRLRLGVLKNERESLVDVLRIVEPYVAGTKTAKTTQGNVQSGHLIFSELADRTAGKSRDRFIALARNAADLAFDADGRLRDSMPNHLEMSDALFMGGPILAHVGALTQEPKYFDACLQHLRFMRKLCLRTDGVYRHSPLDESAWGRGNGFPALGLALCLQHFPPGHPGRDELLGWFRAHMKALLPHQDRTGCWHQIIDHPESYRELTATCMIGFAMQRGIRARWLEGDVFQPAVDRAWHAIKMRVAPNGHLVDVCTGTGKQKSLREYYDRPAILGRDDRGGAMALLFATEMAQFRP